MFTSFPISPVSEPDETAPPKRKRQRLTHLTEDEKQLRRKLKNREAAQSARDRKKAHLEELEAALKELQEQNEALQQENDILTTRLRESELENSQLRAQLSVGSPPASPVKQDSTMSQEVNSLTESASESAALTVSLQQKQLSQSTDNGLLARLVSTLVTVTLIYSASLINYQNSTKVILMLPSSIFLSEVEWTKQQEKAKDIPQQTLIWIPNG